MNRLLVFVYDFDETSQVFSHQVEIVKMLAKHFDQVFVVTPRIGIKERGIYTLDPASKDSIVVIEGNFSRSVGFLSSIKSYFRILNVLRRIRFSSVFYFMTETSAIYFGFYFFVRSCPQTLWYAHAHKSLRLILASIFMNSICSSTKSSMPLKSRRVSLIGQMADPQLFPYSPKSLSKNLKLVHFGRFDESKNIGVLIQVLNRLIQEGIKASLLVIGSPTTHKSRIYQSKIKQEFQDLIEVGVLKILPSQPRAEMRRFLSRCDVFIHAFQGSLDKTLIESTLMGLPVITLNQGYLNEFGTWNKSGDKVVLNFDFFLFQELIAMREINEVDLRREVDNRYQIALREHSLDKWLSNLLLIIDKKSHCPK